MANQRLWMVSQFIQYYRGMLSPKDLTWLDDIARAEGLGDAKALEDFVVFLRSLPDDCIIMLCGDEKSSTELVVFTVNGELLERRRMRTEPLYKK